MIFFIQNFIYTEENKPGLIANIHELIYRYLCTKTRISRRNINSHLARKYGYKYFSFINNTSLSIMIF